MLVIKSSLKTVLLTNLLFLNNGSVRSPTEASITLTISQKRDGQTYNSQLISPYCMRSLCRLRGLSVDSLQCCEANPLCCLFRIKRLYWRKHWITLLHNLRFYILTNWQGHLHMKQSATKYCISSFTVSRQANSQNITLKLSKHYVLYFKLI